MPPDREQQNGSSLWDVDLLQVFEESIRLIEFLNGELNNSLRAADRECVQVGRALQELSRAKASIESLACTDPRLSIIGSYCQQIDASISATVVGLQYHDRLAQRIEHVRTALHRLQSILRESESGTSSEFLRNVKQIEVEYEFEFARLSDSAANGASNRISVAAANDSNVELF